MLTPLFLAAATLASGTKAPKPATNRACPVLGNKVEASSPTVVVRGQTYRLCCKGCDVDLAKHPDTYLLKDGTPRNASGSGGAKH